MIQFGEHIFQMGWFNYQLVYIYDYIHMYIQLIDLDDPILSRKEKTYPTKREK